MKNIKFSLLSVFLMLYITANCQQVVDISTFNQGDNTGKYFKDIDNDFDAFIGVWEHQENDMVFRVTLWKNAQEPYREDENGNPRYYVDQILGHFEMVQLEEDPLGAETVIYTSDKNIGSSQQDWFPVIRIFTSDGVEAWGTVLDNVVFDPDLWINPCLHGTLSFDIIPGTNPPQAVWEVKHRKGAACFSDLPTEFTIPTDIVLTKVQ